MARNTEKVIDFNKAKIEREEDRDLENILSAFVDEAGKELPGTFHAYLTEDDAIKIVAVIPKGVDPLQFIKESIPEGFYDEIK